MSSSAGAVGAYDGPPAREALADVVVGVALESHRDPLRHEGTEGLACGARERDVDRVLRQALTAILLGDLMAQHRADGPVHVADLDLGTDRLAVLQCESGDPDQLVVERLVETVVLTGGVATRSPLGRSEGRRVGEEGVSTCRSR